MPAISPELRTIIWIITGTAAFLFAILSGLLQANLRFFVRRTIPQLWSKGGRPPTRKPFILWLFFTLTALTMIIGAAIADAAPDASPPMTATPQKILTPTEKSTPTLIPLPSLTPTPSPARVELILDVSSRMATILDEPGITKLDVARDSALQLLDTFEGKPVEVALSFVTNSGVPACEISREALRIVEFTQDFDKIRQALKVAKPDESGEAPLVDTLNTLVDQSNEGPGSLKLFIFTGGDDTCQKSVELFFRALRSLYGGSISSDTFLIILLGKEEPPKWATQELGVSLGLARNTREVKQYTENFSNQVVAGLSSLALGPTEKPATNVTQASPFQTLSIPPFTKTLAPTPTFTLPPPTFTFTSTPIPSTATSKPFAILIPPNGTAYSCDPGGLCIVTVTIQWVPEEQSGNLHLSIWIKPFPGDPNYRYYVQPSPYYIGNSQWTSTEIYIGQVGDPTGTPFRIYALVTVEEYFRDQSLNNLPNYILASSVNVTR